MEKKNHPVHPGKAAAADVSQDKSPADLNMLISEAAYDMFVKSGFTHGNDKRDWLRAEKMIYNENEK